MDIEDKSLDLYDAAGNSVEDFTSSSRSGSDTASNRRDEVQEIRNQSRTEDRRVDLWRWTLLFLILAVGVLITTLTYHFLQFEEQKALNIAYDQFTEALSDAAIRQQDDIRDASRAFSAIISDQAALTNQTWPFVALTNFESLGEDFHKISGTEIVTLLPAVTRENTEAWLNFTDKQHAPLMKHSHMLRYKTLDNMMEVGYTSYIQRATSNGLVPDIDRDVYYPLWQVSPPMFTYGAINWNAISLPDIAAMFDAVKVLKYEQLVSPVQPYAIAGLFSEEEHARMHSAIEGSSTKFPHSFIYTPVHLDSQDFDSPIVAISSAAMAWDFSLRSLLPVGVVGIKAVIKNSCNQSFTYEINGPDAFFIGEGDLHEEEFNSYERVVRLSPNSHPDIQSIGGHCLYSMYIYPNSKFVSLYLTTLPTMFAIGVAGAFGFMVIVFYVYNRFVYKRNEKLVENAARSNAVITSLFPDTIRNQLIGDSNTNNPRSFQELLGPASDPVANLTRPPLADYFATATVMFADICGFTAWSSVREPSQVFTLLETLYGSFDRLTKNSKVFKVETVGDSYIAATGIPKYHRDHAVSMVRFAYKISKEMSTMTKMLETTLGPDTSDLLLRIGIHTGPVTAGVIRGDKARFQLFGDTMNVASRVESTGVAGRIHVSKDTADSLRKCNKGHWLVKRENGSVVAKGKGDIQTYWIGKGVEQANKPESFGQCETASESGSSVSADDSVIDGHFSEKIGHSEGREDRLVDWNVTVFLDILKHIVARREAYAKAGINSNSEPRSDDSEVLTRMKMNDCKPINGVREIIALPEFNDVAEAMKVDVQTIEIPADVTAELRRYIATVAGLYRSNPFHNFEHASHVTMSVIKLLSRIKAPSDLELMEGHGGSDDISQDIHAHLHDHTYGITSDPLTQFACAFAALVHDVDHEGVPNAQLVKEGAAVATMYNERSVAEQNSLVIAWNLLMSDRFTNLRNTICATATELSRFRELATNAVMATDIIDKDLKQLRNNRWYKAFKRDISSIDVHDYEEEDETRDSINRKATIVIEHLIQASDVSHTMQHWHVYRKWNENLFRESYAAYIAGRADTDPSINWYKGEIGFFDFYIIPLAKKLESCGVFGKSSDEFLNYARSNREEWESRGESIVAELVANVKKDFKEHI
ncbi:unnamed protein product [Cylindrotheca closterium]|uniref:Phosphodiesterase n=1 Tax=Cylindrotheca closterium TaxID=2856 RepID=A0AAD2FDS4_9STRA|nr:unnamed protein product [Cylindrotheca closterium]